jgi:hypothetical protein
MSAAIPSEANFDHKTKNPGIYRSRVKYFSTNQNSYNPKSTVKIEVDSTKPASFIDGAQTRLDFTVVVYNNNPFIDFINLPRMGWNAIFKEYRLVVGGTNLVNNKDYAYSMEQLFIAQNRNPDPVHIFHSNPWTPPEGETQVNFIKPSMVDRTGNYMYGKYSFTDNNPFDFMYFSRPNHFTEGDFLSTCTKGMECSNVVNLDFPTTNVTTSNTLIGYQNTTTPFYWPQGVGIALADGHVTDCIGSSNERSTVMNTDRVISLFGYYPPGVGGTFGTSGSCFGSGLNMQINNHVTNDTQAKGGYTTLSGDSDGGRLSLIHI